MKRLLFLLSTLTLSATTALAATPETRPSWCHSGYECIPRAELVADAEYHLDLREQVIKYKARARRFGFTVGPGVGVTEALDENLDLHRVYGAGFYVVWGLRFP